MVRHFRAPDTFWNSGTSRSIILVRARDGVGIAESRLPRNSPKRFTLERIGEGVRLAQIPCIELLTCDSNQRIVLMPGSTECPRFS